MVTHAALLLPSLGLRGKPVTAAVLDSYRESERAANNISAGSTAATEYISQHMMMLIA